MTAHNMKINYILRWSAVIVAAISAITVALLSESGRGLPQTPSRQACARRLAKLGQALRLYARDHEGLFPISATPANSDKHLLALLEEYGATRKDFYCPAGNRNTSLPYTYHCYSDRGADDWPKWMPARHVVSLESPPGTWLMADFLARDAPGPHSNTEKAFNYLCTDGRVYFHRGRPREVYR